MSTPNKYGPHVGSRARWLRHYETTPSAAGRRVRRAMGVILRLPQGEAVKAVRRLLGVDPVAAASFLDQWTGEPSPVRKPPLFPRAFNAPAFARNAAKAQRRAQRAAGVRL